MQVVVVGGGLLQVVVVGGGLVQVVVVVLQVHLFVLVVLYLGVVVLHVVVNDEIIPGLRVFVFVVVTEGFSDVGSFAVVVVFVIDFVVETFKLAK